MLFVEQNLNGKDQQPLILLKQYNLSIHSYLEVTMINKNTILLPILITFYSLMSLPLKAESQSLDYADVEHVKATQSKDGSWCFSTQVRHNDQGWDHYANSWQVHDLEGNLLSKRVLLHPHDNEQPFTRNQCGIVIPKTLTHVVVSASCEEHGLGGRAVQLNMNKTSGEGFTLIPYQL